MGDFGTSPVKLANEHLLNGIEYYEEVMTSIEDTE